MTVVYHEILAASYLLVLGPNQTASDEAELAHWLRRAQRSGKPAVWVDCGLLNSLSEEAARLLWASHYQLQQQNALLVLVHLPDRARRELLDQELGPVPCIVPTLLDAAAQTYWRTGTFRA